MSGSIESLNRAKAMALENSQLFPEVFRTILPIVYNNDLELQKWCVNFLVDAYTNADGKLPKDLLKDLSVDMIDPMQVLIKVQDVVVMQKTIHLLVLAYEFIFLNVLQNGSAHESQAHWQKLGDLKQEIMINFRTSAPLVSYNKQSDQFRSISCKLQTIQLIGKVAEIQLPTPPKDPRMRRHAPKNQEEDTSISMIPPNHPVLKKSLEAEGQALLDLLFNFLNDEALVITPIFSAIELIIVKLFKKRPNHVYNKLTNLLMMYESDAKKHSKFEKSEAKLKLIRRFNDRFNKVLIGFMINKKLVKDATLQQKMSKKFSYVMMRNDIAKKRGILNDSDDEGDSMAKRRKLDAGELPTDEVFFNSSPITKDLRISSLYSLINPKDKVNDVDLSVIPQEILTQMVVIALKKADKAKIVEGLTIIAERYRELLARPSTLALTSEESLQVPKSAKDDDDEDDDGVNVADDVDDLSGVTYDLPIPNRMSFVEKKKHVKRIVSNFFKVANAEVSTGPNLSEKLESNQSDLTKVAIPSWNKQSWLVVLSRLASRGLNRVSEDDGEKEILGDIVRDEVFTYFTQDIRNRIDVCIEWLNEEWYSETIRNEKLAQKGEMSEEDVKNTPTYFKWAGKVLDTFILFLEASDRKLFIRLISDLPYLNKDLVWKIRSLCLDPTRFKIGFQSLQFLAIYRPPLKDSAVSLLKNLYEDFKDKTEGNEDFNKECFSLLQKLCPGEFSSS